MALWLRWNCATGLEREYDVENHKSGSEQQDQCQ